MIYRIALAFCCALFFSRAASATYGEGSLETVSDVGDIGQIGKCHYDGSIRLQQGDMPSAHAVHHHSGNCRLRLFIQILTSNMVNSCA
jgi:hypothetical protein